MRFVTILLALAGSALAQGRRADQILADHAKAVGPMESVLALKGTGTANLGRRAFPSVTTWLQGGLSLRTMVRGPIEYVGPQGVYFAESGAFFRFRESSDNMRGAAYVQRMLAQPFPLLRYLRNRKAAAALRVDLADDYEVLRTPADAHGFYRLYLIDKKTHLLARVRIESGPKRQSAVMIYGDYKRVGGVMLPHRIRSVYVIRVEVEKSEKVEFQRVHREDHILKWTVNPDMRNVTFEVPGLGKGGAEGFERRALSTGISPYESGVGDLDGDGRNDIAVACRNGLSIHFGGALGETVFVPTCDGQMRGIAILDTDSDGRPEVMSMSRNTPPKMYFRVAFDAKRKPSVTKMIGAPQLGYALKTADLDRDGVLDLVGTSWGGAREGRALHLLFGNGVGAFRVVGSRWPLANRKNPKPRGLGIAIGRLDPDGLDDIMVADGMRVRPFMGRVNLAFIPGPPIPCGPRPVDVVLADLNGDGNNDLVVANELPFSDVRGDLAVLLNDGRKLKAHAKVEAGERVSSIAKGDLNGDGRIDIVATSYLTGEVTLLEGDGKGGLEQAGRLSSGRGAHRVIVADMDGDGRDDVVCANRLQDTVVLFYNRRPFKAAAPVGRRGVEVAPATPVEVDFRLEGLSSPYEFVAEFKIPTRIPDPSGVAWLGGDGAHQQFVVVSDKKEALFRLILDTAGKRLLVGPAIPLKGHKGERLDLEGLAFDRASGSLFLASEASSTILRANLFGQVVDQVPTGIEHGGNDGIEALAFRRRLDGTPLLYVFRERLGRTLGKPPVHVFGLAEDPFGLVRRGEPRKLPIPTIDQTGATLLDGKLMFLTRSLRAIAEIDFEGDGFKPGARRASFAKLAVALGYVGLPMGEAITASAGGDLFLVVDNNGRPIGTEGKNLGPEGRLIWLRRVEPLKRREVPRKVTVKQIFIPWEGAVGNPGVKRTRAQASALAKACLARIRKGVAFDKVATEVHEPGGRLPAVMKILQPPASRERGVFMANDLPRALSRLAFALDVGQVAICEWHRSDSPHGFHVVLRIE